MFEYMIHDKMSVEDLLRSKWQVGRKIIHELRMQKAITFQDGTPVRWNEPIEKDTVLQFHMKVPRSKYTPTTQCAVEICYEDEHCLVVNKPKGMATHPNNENDMNTCMNHVMAHVLTDGGIYAEHVHRLDAGTSGLVLVAKHPIAKSIFDRRLEEKKIVRIYEAEVQGVVKQDKGTINAPIGRDRHHGSRRIVSKSGQKAVTHFEVVKRMKNSTILHLQLKTGRTHQIRVHMAYLGHPIIGDTLYGGPKTKDGTYRLHAVKLIFYHPFLQKEIQVEADSSSIV